MTGSIECGMRRSIGGCGTEFCEAIHPAPMEPCIFGIFSPVLLLPEGILERPSAAQLRAIVAREMCRVRLRDNLTCVVTTGGAVASRSLAGSNSRGRGRSDALRG